MANEELLKKAVEAFNDLSPEQQARMLEEQRQSWVRGNVGLSRDERGLTTRLKPSAPGGGLDRYGQNWQGAMLPNKEGNFVLFYQAEAIIAAERAKISLAETTMIEIHQDLNKLEADNAALTARVKELEASLRTRNTDDMNDMVLIGMARDDAENRAKALETQLAAARKALKERTLRDVGELCAWLSENEENGILLVNNMSPELLEKARTVLEAKP